MSAPAPHLSVVKPNWFMDPSEKSLDAQKAKADFHFANNQFEEALSICLALRNGNTKLSKSMAGQIDDTQIRCHLNLNQPAEALEMLSAKLSRNRASTPPNFLRMYAEAHYQLRHARECVDVYFDIVTRDPVDVRNWRDLGQIFEDFGLYRLKSICFHRALELAERQRASRRYHSGSDHYLSQEADDELIRSIKAGLDAGPPPVSVETLAASNPEIAAFIANEEAYVNRVEQLLEKPTKLGDESAKPDKNMVPNRSEVVSKPYDATLPPPSTPAPTVSEIEARKAASEAASTDESKQEGAASSGASKKDLNPPSATVSEVEARKAASGTANTNESKQKNNSSIFRRFEMSFTKRFSASKKGAAASSSASKKNVNPPSASKRASKRERSDQGESDHKQLLKTSLFSPKKDKRRSEAPPKFSLTPSQQAKKNIAQGVNDQPKKKRLHKLAQKIKNVRKKPGDIPELVPQSPGRITKRAKKNTPPSSSDAPWWQLSRTTLRNVLVVAGVAATVTVIALYARNRSPSSSRSTRRPRSSFPVDSVAFTV